jgi:gluconate 5-dehydrogenase
MATNLDAVFFVARAVGRRVVERGVGKIINVGSVLGFAARPGTAPYAASKAAAHGLTRALRRVGRPRRAGQRHRPGRLRDRDDAALHGNPEVSAYVRARTPAGHWGRPEDLAGAAVFLAAPASDFVNGQIVVVDGGILAVI